MSTPINPNFNPGTLARIATDRYDFQKHVDGYSFRHVASSIDVSPPITISSIDYTTVQSALAALASVIVPSVTVPDATLTTKGIIQLTGDLGGSATNVRVIKIQGNSVSNLAPTNGQVLTWDSGISSWKPVTSSSNFTAAGDLFGDNTTQTVVRIQGRAVVNTAPTDHQVLEWIASNNRWEPTTIIPTGTGFATVTSGLFDAAATANIRYTGGKFQTDANIQYKNGAVTGDLSWTPTSTNKTLTLPNATDTLVGLATTDTLTNKTINATNNTITDTSTVTGDLLKSNGTKFLRFAKGTALQVLRVNSAGTDLEFATPSNSTPTGTGFVTVTAGVFDPTGTANIRYTGAGRLQTDVGVQFKNSAILGDLTWTPTTTNKTLLLPDISDTLVTKTSTDTLTNKTLDVAGTGNALTSTSQATGDLLKNDGTKFLRFPRGSGLQLLRTNAGGTDLEWATVSLPSTQISIDQVGAGQLNNITSTSGSGDVVIIRFTGDGAATDITLSGIAGGSGVRRICLVATSTSRLLLSNEDTNSSATNRLHFFGGAAATYSVGTDGYAVDVVWDATISRWRPIINLRAMQ